MDNAPAPRRRRWPSRADRALAESAAFEVDVSVHGGEALFLTQLEPPDQARPVPGWFRTLGGRQKSTAVLARLFHFLVHVVEDFLDFFDGLFG